MSGKIEHKDVSRKLSKAKWESDSIHLVDGVESLSVLVTTDVDDTPVNGVTTAPVSSNWAFDHNAADTAVHGAGSDTLATDADITTHATDASAHHIKYTDAEARTACVEDAAYGAGWNADTTHAPSQNAVYDKVATHESDASAHHIKYTDAEARTAVVSDTAYDATTWNGVTTYAPSKNAVRDQLETHYADASVHHIKYTNAEAQAAAVSDAAYDATAWDGTTDVAPSKNAVRDKIETLGAGGAHAILDGSVHNDSVADAVTRGSIIYGNATPKWDELVLGAAGTVPRSDGTSLAFGYGAALQDADGDTQVMVEEGADEDIIRMDVGGAGGDNVFLMSAAGIVTLAKQPAASGYLATADQVVPTGTTAKVLLNAEYFDVQNELNSTVKTGTADATGANKLHDADGGFAASDVGAAIWNTTDNTYTTVTGFVDSGELDLDDDIMVDTEGYKLYHSRITVTEAGIYIITANIYWNVTVADQFYQIRLDKNGTGIANAILHSSIAEDLIPFCSITVDLAATDYIEISGYHTGGENQSIKFAGGKTRLGVTKIA